MNEVKSNVHDRFMMRSVQISRPREFTFLLLVTPGVLDVGRRGTRIHSLILFTKPTLAPCE